MVLSAVDLGQPFPGFRLSADQNVDLNLASDWTGAKAGLRPTDRILAVDGRKLPSSAAIVAYAHERPVGTPIRYDIVRADLADRHTRLTVEVPTQRLGMVSWLVSAFLFWLTGIIYLVLGTVVSLLRPNDGVARAHLVFSWATAFNYLTAYLPNTAWALPFWVNGLAMLTVGASMVNLSLRLPRLVGGQRMRWLQIGNAIVWATVAAVFVWALEADRYPMATHVGAYALPLLAGIPFLGNPIWTMASRGSTETERAQATIICGGLALVVAGAVVLEFGGIIGLPGPFWLPSTILMMALPVAIAAAIVYHRLFAIEVRFRKSLTYSLLATLLAVLYLAVIGGLAALGGAAGVNEVVGTLAVTVAFSPLRNLIRTWLDRAFFRTAYDPMAALARFAAASRATGDPAILASDLCLVVRDCLAPEWLRFEEAEPAVPGSGPGSAAEADFHLALGSPDAPFGTLALGRRRSGLPYSQADRKLLSGLADHFALWLDQYRHIDNARRHEAERDAARRSEAMQRAFLGLVSHELRTPLSTILLAAESLDRARNGDAPPGGQGPVDRIRRGATTLSRFVEDLLDAAQLEAGVFRLRREPADLGKIALEAAQEMRPVAEAKHQELEVAIPPSHLPVLADTHRLLQVFRNLLHNASKFTPAGGRIALRVAERGASAAVAVSDSGPGLTAAEAARAFTRFGAGERHSGHGAGLGLFIAKELVEAHGGSISITSSAGRGAELSFRIPLDPMPAESLEPAQVLPDKVGPWRD